MDPAGPVMARLAATPTKAGGSDYTRKTETLVDPRILEFRQMGQENGKKDGIRASQLLESAGLCWPLTGRRLPTSMDRYWLPDCICQ